MATFEDVITDINGLRAVIASPSNRVIDKVTGTIDEMTARFIAASPFAVIASRNADGHLDLSPKGDTPGSFVQVLDERTLAVPDRLGNRRVDTLVNLLGDPNLGLIFLIPGKRETLRIGGTAQIVRDTWVRERLAHQGKLPDLVIVATVQRLFFHCAKCTTRSRLWQPEAWAPVDELASLAETMVTHGKLAETVAEMQAIIDNDERTRLY